MERAQDEVKDLAERLDGVVERSTLRVIDDEAVATVRIRVPRDVFLQAVDSIEDLGDVRRKTLEEGGQSRFLDLPADFVIEEPDEPDALIDVRLTSDGGSDTYRNFLERPRAAAATPASENAQSNSDSPS